MECVRRASLCSEKSFYILSFLSITIPLYLFHPHQSLSLSFFLSFVLSFSRSFSHISCPFPQVASLQSMLARFPRVKAAARQVALVPADGGLFEYALARVATAITFEKHGLVSARTSF